MVDGSYYVDGLLISSLGVLPASIMVALIAGAIMVAITVRALNKSSYSFWLVLSNPTKALSLITESLAKLIDCVNVSMMIKRIDVNYALHGLCYMLIDSI